MGKLLEMFRNKEQDSFSIDESAVQDVTREIDDIIKAYEIPGYTTASTSRTLILGGFAIRRSTLLQTSAGGHTIGFRHVYFLEAPSPEDQLSLEGIKITRGLFFTYQRRYDQDFSDIESKLSTREYAKEFLARFPHGAGLFAPQETKSIE